MTAGLPCCILQVCNPPLAFGESDEENPRARGIVDLCRPNENRWAADCRNEPRPVPPTSSASGFKRVSFFQVQMADASAKKAS